MRTPLPFLRIPPFPGHRAQPLAVPGTSHADPAELAAALSAAQVGSTFWAAEPHIPTTRDVLLAPDTPEQARTLADAAHADGLATRALLVGPHASRHGIPVLARLANPWALAAAATEIRAGADHELALVAALARVPLAVTGEGRYAALDGTPAALHAVLAETLVASWQYRDPFTGARIDPLEAVALLAEWRRLIDTNRENRAVFGIARWKRVTMDALLWDGAHPVPHERNAATIAPRARVLAWRSRTAPAALETLAERGATLIEIEDGMIRSAGLGANCVPPLSILVEPLAPHFDPTHPSTLENLLQHGEITPEITARAAALRTRLVATGISKYAQATSAPAPLRKGARRRVLVTGQVEDDRAVLLGGADMTNRVLLARARAAEPDAELVYKPHPDVEAGHRKGHVPEAEVLALADRIDRTSPITTLLAEADALHVISSLAGFEALLRGVAVTTHGVPFYAGWGLTTDLGPVPERRTRRRTLDELVAATLILYPRYLDPVTRLPCPVEVLVERMAAGEATVTSPLVTLREWQGRARKLLRRG